MNSQQFKQLIKTNLLYLNPQQTLQYRKKGKTGDEISFAILRQYLLLTLLFLVLYGTQLLPVNFMKFPGLFTYYLGLFSMMELTQIITSVYSVFYNSQDFEAFAPLPFSHQAIFLSKLTVVLLSTLSFMIPTIALFIFFGIHAAYGAILGALWGVCLSFILLLTVVCLGMLIVFAVSKIHYLQQHRKLLTSILFFVPIAIMLIGVFTLSRVTASASMTADDTGTFPFLLPFYRLVKNPGQTQDLLILGGIIIFIGFFFWLMVTRMLPAFYTTETLTATKKRGRTYQLGTHSLARQLWHYNFGLLKDPNLLIQLFAGNIMPLMLIMLFSLNGSEFSLAQTSSKFAGAFILIGCTFALVSTNQGSIAANIISLDRQNFQFVNALPLTMKTYLRSKFNFAVFCQSILTLVILLIGGLLLKIPLLLLLAMLLSNLLTTILCATYYFVRDLRHLNTEWTNVSQLFTRGGGNFVIMLTLFITMALAAVVIGLYFLLLLGLHVPPVILNLLTAILVLVASFFVLNHYHQRFWQQLDHVSIDHFIDSI